MENQTLLDVLDAIQEEIIDPSAYTLREIMAHKGWQQNKAMLWVQARVKSGEIERVKKYDENNRLVSAYRLKVKK
jgi:hypothetical protein